MFTGFEGRNPLDDVFSASASSGGNFPAAADFCVFSNRRFYQMKDLGLSCTRKDARKSHVILGTLYCYIKRASLCNVTQRWFLGTIVEPRCVKSARTLIFSIFGDFSAARHSSGAGKCNFEDLSSDLSINAKDPG